MLTRARIFKRGASVIVNVIAFTLIYTYFTIPHGFDINKCPPENNVMQKQKSKEFSVNPDWWCDVPTDIPNPLYKREHVPDPSNYMKWMHPFWTPEKSYDMASYINVEDMVNFDLEDCSNDSWKSYVKVFMVIHSDPNPGGEVPRNDIRNSWMKWTKVMIVIKSF